LALRPIDNETFYREVDEELRRDQLKTYWERFGKLFIAGVVLILAAIGGLIWWQNHKQVVAGERGAQLIGAFDDIAAGNKAAAGPKLDELAKSGSDGYRAAALLTKADLLIEGGHTDQAAAQMSAVASDTGLPQQYRDLAVVRATALQFDKLKPQAVIDKLKPFAVAGHAWFGSAGEMSAIAYLKMNRPQDAGRLYAAMAKDKSVPDSIRSRSAQMASSLGVDAVQPAQNGQEGQ
jgi:hypothetical protein